MERSASRRTREPEELRCLSKIPEHDDRPIEQQCDHFTIRRCVALLQQNDPTLCSLSHISCDHAGEQCKNPWPISGPQFRRSNCSNCLKKVQNAGHATTLPTVSVNQDGCSISVVQTFMPSSVARTLCADRQSQGNNVGRSTPLKCFQESHSKCISPSSNKGVTEANVYLAMKGVPKPILGHSNVHSGGDQVYNRVQHEASSKKNDISYLKVYQRRSVKKRLM